MPPWPTRSQRQRFVLGHHIHADLHRGECAEQLGAHEVAEAHAGFRTAREQRAAFGQSCEEFAGAERVVDESAAVGVNIVRDGGAEQRAIQGAGVDRSADCSCELSEQTNPCVEVGGEVVGVLMPARSPAGVVTRSTSGAGVPACVRVQPWRRWRCRRKRCRCARVRSWWPPYRCQHRPPAERM